MKTLMKDLLSKIDAATIEEKIWGSLISVEVVRNSNGHEVKIGTSPNASENGSYGYLGNLSNHQNIEIQSPREYSIEDVVVILEKILPTASFELSTNSDGFFAEIDRLDFEEDFSEALRKWRH